MRSWVRWLCGCWPCCNYCRCSSKTGWSCFDLVGKNLAINKSIVTQVIESGFNGIFLVFAQLRFWHTLHGNSQDSLKNSVIGSGTSLLTQLVSVKHLLRKLGWCSFSARLSWVNMEFRNSLYGHASIAGVNSEEFIKDTQNVQETELIELFEGVRDAAHHHQQKGAYARYRCLPLLITKQSLMMKMQYFHFLYSRKVQYGVSNVFIGQPAIVGARYCTSVNPLNVQNNKMKLLLMNCKQSLMKHGKTLNSKGNYKLEKSPY